MNPLQNLHKKITDEDCQVIYYLCTQAEKNYKPTVCMEMPARFLRSMAHKILALHASHATSRATEKAWKEKFHEIRNAVRKEIMPRSHALGVRDAWRTAEQLAESMGQDEFYEKLRKKSIKLIAAGKKADAGDPAEGKEMGIVPIEGKAKLGSAVTGGIAGVSLTPGPGIAAMVREKTIEELLIAGARSGIIPADVLLAWQKRSDSNQRARIKVEAEYGALKKEILGFDMDAPADDLDVAIGRAAGENGGEE